MDSLSTRTPCNCWISRCPPPIVARNSSRSSSHGVRKTILKNSRRPESTSYAPLMRTVLLIGRSFHQICTV